MFAKRTNWNLQPNRLSEALAAHRAAGQPLLDLTASNPTECGFHYDVNAVFEALQNPAAMRYEPNPRGLPSARAAVRKYYEEQGGEGRRVAGEDIFLTTSTSEAYSFAFRTLCDPGDEVLIPEPSYPLFEFLADIQDVRPVRYALVYDHGWQMDFASLQRAISPRTRAVIVVNPNNPTGNDCQPHEMRELNEICAARGLAIIADEVFLDFRLSADDRPANVERGPGVRSFAANDAALTFTLSGISKICGLPQMKVAWLLVSGPETLKTATLPRLELIADTYLSLNTPVQCALPALLELRHGFQAEVRTRLRRNLAELDRQLGQNPGVERLKVAAGWNAVLRVPATQPDEELALRLLCEQGVYIHPGHFYDFHRDGYLVVSLLTPEEEFAAGIQKIIASVA